MKLLLALALLSSAALAQENTEVQPYIEKLKEKHGIRQDTTRDGVTQPHIEYLKRQGDVGERTKTDEVQPYINRIKNEDGDFTTATENADQPKSPPANPTDAQAQPYIEALKQGHELEPKFKKPVHQALTLSVVTGSTIDLDPGEARANSFNSVYRTEKKYNPAVEMQYEYHLLRDRMFGALGPFIRAGVIVAKGTGRFSRRNEETDVKFTFTAFPLTSGFIYRANQLRFFVPFVQGGLVATPFFETRKDDKESRRGMAYNFAYTYGAAFSLDWISRKSAWSRYDEQGILHTYIFIHRQGMRKLAGDVDFKTDMTMAGLTFEF